MPPEAPPSSTRWTSSQPQSRRRSCKNDLAKIGIQVQIHAFSSSDYWSLLATPGAPFDLAYYGWTADYPDPDDFLNFLLDNSSNLPTLDDPLAQQRMATAARLSGPERYLTYGALDLDLARNAAPAGRVWQPLEPRLLLGADRLPDVRDLRDGPRGALQPSFLPTVIRNCGPAADRD